MSSYPSISPEFDPERAEGYRLEVERAQPVAEDDPAFLYLTGTRGIPAETVLGCADLRTLQAPILYRPKTDYACVSLLRPMPGVEPTGAELVFVDVRGRPIGGDRGRLQWAFVKNGCRDAWFWAGGEGDVAVVAEGFLAKPLALRAAGIPGVCLGWGSRSWLPFKKLPPTIKRLTIVPDRRPDDAGLADHDRDYRRALDHWLLDLGEGAVLIAPGPETLP